MWTSKRVHDLYPYSFFIFLPEEEDMLYINRVSGWRQGKDDPADICPKEFLEIRSWEIQR